MSTAITETTEPTNPFDARGPFLLSLFMTLVGYSVLVALPAINSAWVDQLGFTEVQVNRVASADLLGLFIGAVITSLLIRRSNRQHLKPHHLGSHRPHELRRRKSRTLELYTDLGT